MSSILPSAQAYLDSTTSIRRYKLVRFELAASTVGNRQYDYLTTAPSNITWDGKQFLAGKVTKVSAIKATTKLTSHKVTLTIAGEYQEEIDRALLVSTGSTTSSYLNKDIKIWDVLLDDNDNIIPFASNGPTGTDPLEVFRGVITNISIKDSATRSTVTWSCSDQFADFNRVNGRLTDDGYHRALGADGAPTNAVKRPEYANDLGFYHANKSVSVLAEYQALETRYKMKSSWFGLKSKLKEYQVEVTKNIDININLEGKRIPTVYGVRNVGSVPVFVDSLAADPSTVYAVYAVCEGEIEGFLDIHLDDKPIVCYGGEDNEDVRLCVGNKRNGDTIAVAETSNPAPPRTQGSTHGEHYIYESDSQVVEFWTYHGKSDQAASQVLVDIAASNGFLRQSTEGIPGQEYWGTNHKLLDTAYLVVKFQVDGANATIPQVDPTVEGRKVRVYSDEVTSINTHTSLNPIWQILDYLLEPRFGVGIPFDSIDITSLLQAAASCDLLDTTYSNSVDSSFVPFWRYIGWKDSTASNATIIQANMLIDTSSTLFSALEAVLAQFKLSLNMSNGVYRLDLETASPTIADIPQWGTIGEISVKDLTDANQWNSVKATIEEPALGFEKRNVTFYNSDFVEADAGVEKQGNINYFSVTNFYTARSMAERDLKDSRFSRRVSVKVHFRYAYLYPTAVITLTNERFNWSSKEFRVENITRNVDDTVTLDLKEYKDIYTGDTEQNQDGDNTTDPVVVRVLPPRNLSFIPSTAEPMPANTPGLLRWDPSLTTDTSYYKIHWDGANQIYVVQSNLLTEQGYEFLLPEGTSGLIEFKVWAVNSSGEQSVPTTVIYDVGNPAYIDIVPNFVIATEYRDPNTGGWYTANMVTEITTIPNTTIDNYYVEVINNNGIVIYNEYVPPTDNTITETLPWSFVAADNAAAYLAEEGTEGVYRLLEARVKAVGVNVSSVDWRYLQ